jgi:hypothetical protein
MTARPSDSTIIWAPLLNAPTILMVAAWFVLAVFATAIGSKPPTASEYMAILWPAFAGLAVALLSLWVAFRASRGIGAVLGIAGWAIMPIAFSAMMP